jgi:mRNA interferase RelE/StbE
VPFEIKYHPDIKNKDILKFDSVVKERVKKAIETKLLKTPHNYGEPLRRTLKGYWKLRVGDYRVIFRVYEERIFILGIRHRNEVYKNMIERIKGVNK